MRILVAANDLTPGGGAQTVANDTIRWLRDAGHEVSTLTAPGAPARVRAPALRRVVERLVAESRPDVAHLHNVYERLTLTLVDALADAGVPVVVTLHDYRAVCPNGILLAPDGPCRRCVTGSPLHAVRLGCLHGSRVASARAAAEVAFNRRRGTWHRAGALLAPTRVLAGVMADGGLPADRIVHLPNAVAAAPRPPATPPGPARFVFAGRLTPAKGLDTLLGAAARLPEGARIEVWGAGRSAAELTRRAAGLPVDVRGATDPAGVAAAYRGARAVLAPSLWEENGPLAILEAGAQGVPAVASDLGGPRELIADGVDGRLVAPGDAGALARVLAELAADPARARALGAAAHRRVRARHHPARYLERLLEVYAGVATAGCSRACASAPARAWSAASAGR